MRKLVLYLKVFAVAAVTVLIMTACPYIYDDIDTKGIPKFVSVNYIDLSQKDEYGHYLISQISPFRSSEGHDYSDDFENNRTMKHYFYRPNSKTKVYSPVSGTVIRIMKESSETFGRQMHIASDLYPSFVFVICHFEPVKDFVFGEKVSEGQLLGHHTRSEYTVASDIVVNVHTSKGFKLISYFETLTPQALKPFTDRYSVSNPGRDFLEDVIITKAQRDSYPLTVKKDELYSNADGDPWPKYIYLDLPYPY